MVFRTYRDEESGSPVDSPSAAACAVCGHHALVEDTVHEFAAGMTDRWICQLCGAHSVL